MQNHFNIGSRYGFLFLINCSTSFYNEPKNIDHLFQLDAFSAVVAGQAYPGHETWRHLNSGLLVVEPEPGLKERLVATIPSEVSKPLGDQDIIQAYQSNWPNENRLHLKESYNLFIDCIDYYIRHGILQESDIYVIHFEGGQKPWKWFPGEYVLRVIRMALKRHFYEFKYLSLYRKYIAQARQICE